MKHFFAAIQFLTRIPTPHYAYDDQTLPGSLLYFPVIGAALGAGAGLLNHLLAPHLPRTLTALIVTAAMVLITGALHEDGLADCADAFGSRHPHARTLEILRDSRIGSYGAIALVLSLGARILLLASLPPERVLPYLIAAHTLARWSSLPLTLLPAARPDSGQGVRVARRTPAYVLILGSAIALLVAILTHTLIALVAAIAVTRLTATFYNRRLQGVTGDCFGATNQLVEISVLLCGVWV